MELAEEWSEKQARWGVSLGEEIKIPAMATSADWRGCVPGTTAERGKNHPLIGKWALERYVSDRLATRVVDPMIGVGGLFLRASGLFKVLLGGDCIEALVDMAKENMRIHAPSVETHLFVGDARHLRFSEPADIVLTSPPYRQSHSAGATAHQQKIIQDKHIHTVQEFRKSPVSLANHKKRDPFFEQMGIVYARMGTYLKPNGLILAVLRNFIREGEEQDDIMEHLRRIIWAGFKIERIHPRYVRPTFYQQAKLTKNPDMPTIRTEWLIVARKDWTE